MSTSNTLKSRFSRKCFSLFTRAIPNKDAIIEMEEEIDNDQHLKHKSVLIFGGGGILGTKSIFEFKMQNWWVCCIDAIANTHADVNIIIASDESASKQEHDILTSLKSILSDRKLDMIICASSECIPGTLHGDFVKVSSKLWKDNVQSAVVCSALACKYLKLSGVLVLLSDPSALKPNSDKIAYDICKSAVIHLIRCLACPDSGLPKNGVVLGLLPKRLDTYATRSTLPESDVGTFTPLQYVSDLLIRWGLRKDLPSSGSLVQLTTNNFNTDLILQR